MNNVPGWVMGIIGGLILTAITGTATTLFIMNAQIARLEATQAQLIKSVDRTLDALTQ